MVFRVRVRFSWRRLLAGRMFSWRERSRVRASRGTRCLRRRLDSAAAQKAETRRARRRGWRSVARLRPPMNARPEGVCRRPSRGRGTWGACQHQGKGGTSRTWPHAHCPRSVRRRLLSWPARFVVGKGHIRDRVRGGTPTAIMEPFRLGTLSVVPVRKSPQMMPATAPRQGHDDDEGSSQTLVVHPHEQVDEHEAEGSRCRGGEGDSMSVDRP